MKQKMTRRPAVEEIRQEMAELRKRRARRRRVLTVLLTVLTLTGVLLFTVAEPMRLTEACEDPAMPKGAVVLVNRLCVEGQPGDVVLCLENAGCVEPFRGLAQRVGETGCTGVLGRVWLEIWPALRMVW
ncbi:MAG: hypothetical protein ACI4MJ_08730 [Aristaeellaceae bacterium]